MEKWVVCEDFPSFLDNVLLSLCGLGEKHKFLRVSSACRPVSFLPSFPKDYVIPGWEGGEGDRSFFSCPP